MEYTNKKNNKRNEFRCEMNQFARTANNMFEYVYVVPTLGIQSWSGYDLGEIESQHKIVYHSKMNANISIECKNFYITCFEWQTALFYSKIKFMRKSSRVRPNAAAAFSGHPVNRIAWPSNRHRAGRPTRPAPQRVTRTQTNILIQMTHRQNYCDATSRTPNVNVTTRATVRPPAWPPACTCIAISRFRTMNRAMETCNYTSASVRIAHVACAHHYQPTSISRNINIASHCIAATSCWPPLQCRQTVASRCATISAADINYIWIIKAAETDGWRSVGVFRRNLLCSARWSMYDVQARWRFFPSKLLLLVARYWQHIIMMFIAWVTYFQIEY